jgi:hypothetical protein
MAKSPYEIGRAAADETITIACAAGYEINPRRGLFFRSDLLELADLIAGWVEEHMRLDEGDA